MSENNYPVKINEAELKAKLDPLSYEVLRNAATERPFTGEYTDSYKVGVYKCKACAAELFRSETKFHSGCGWPSFYAPSADDAVELIEDRSLAPRVRTETCDVRDLQGLSATESRVVNSFGGRVDTCRGAGDGAGGWPACGCAAGSLSP